MENRIVPAGTKLIHENHTPEKLYVIKDGTIEASSMFCDRTRIFIGNEVFGEEIIWGIKAFENITTLTQTTLTEVSKDLAEKFLLSSPKLLYHLIIKRIDMISSYNEKIMAGILAEKKKKEEEKEEYLKKIREQEERLKNNPDIIYDEEEEEKKKKEKEKRSLAEIEFRKVRRGKWFSLNHPELKKYLKAREDINNYNYKSALKTLNTIAIAEFDLNFQMEIEIWRAYVTFFLDKEKGLFFERMIRDKYGKELMKSLSYSILRYTILSEEFPPILKTYMKNGYTFPKNTVFFFEGDEGDWAFLIISGNVRVSKFSDGKEKFITVLTSGEVLGEIACFKKVKRTATVFTLSPTQIIMIKSNDLENMVNQNTDFGLRVLKSLIMRLDFERQLDYSVGFDEKLEVLFSRFSKDELNKLRLNIKELGNLLRLNLKGGTQDLLKIIQSRKNITLKPDGSLKFI